jgi:hypothetical protein
MKRPAVTVVAGVWVFSAAVFIASPQGGSESSFENLKALVGEWEATMEGGNTVRSSYRLISNGTAVMESVNDATHQDMVTIYHRDGDELIAAHFCSSGNQPRMRAEVGGPRGELLTFSLFDVTNLTDPGQRHIRRITFRFEDRDHYTQEWTERVLGKDSVDVLHFVRKK